MGKKYKKKKTAFNKKQSFSKKQTEFTEEKFDELMKRYQEHQAPLKFV